MNYVESTLDLFVKQSAAAVAPRLQKEKTPDMGLEDYATGAALLAATGAAGYEGYKAYQDYKKTDPTLIQEEAPKVEPLIDPDTMLAGAGVVGGKKLVDRAIPMLTGVETLYHGTTKETADAIRRQGLKPVMSSAEGALRGGGGLTNMVGADSFASFESEAQAKDFFKQLEKLKETKDPKEIDKLRKAMEKQFKGRGGNALVYLDRGKGTARTYAHTADMIKHFGEAGVRQAQEPIEAFKAMFGLGGGEVLKARVPYQVQRLALANPEIAHLMQSDPTWYLDRVAQAQEKAQKLMAAGQLKTQTVALPELDPKYLKGHADYRYFRPEQFKDYVKNYKGRMLRGAGLGAIGLGIAGLSGKHLYDKWTKKNQ